MTETAIQPLEFGDQAALGAALSNVVRGNREPAILKVVADVMRHRAAGRTVLDFSVGDFDPRFFPIPDAVAEGVRAALAAGETNYPPAAGVLRLRRAITDYIARGWGVRYPVESVIVTSGGRPTLYGAYRCVVDHGDTVLFSVPSWHNDHYCWLLGAKAIAVPASPDCGFQPTLDDFKPHLSKASLVCICSPGNPTGTIIESEELKRILVAVVEENARREKKGRRPLFVLHDQIYSALVGKGQRHEYAVSLVPESAPYVIAGDGASKAFAGTGLRVGWVLAAPAVAARIRDVLSHVGTWAPHAEQTAVAHFLENENALRAYREQMDAQLHARLEATYDGFAALEADGYPVRCIRPQGAIYVTVQIDLIGRTVEGVHLDSNEALRSWILEKTSVALVPFEAFAYPEGSGWFRLSVGAVSMDEIHGVFPAFRAALEGMKRAN
jgi:aspartate aminotransferase